MNIDYITLRIWILSLFFATLAICSSDAQVDKKSKYNLKYVSIEFLDGRRIQEELFYASHDSLVMIDKNKIVVGSKVILQFKSKSTKLTGLVLEITDTSLVIAQWKTADRKVVLLSQVDRISIKSYPHMRDQKESQQVVYNSSNIKSIQLHRKGSGAMGALAWVAGSVAISFLFPAGNDGDGRPLIGAFLGLVSVPVGVAIGSSNKNYLINGRQEQFDLFIEKLYK